MAREPRQAEQDEDPGAPEWMVTFSDCMTLLLTFFVLLLSFSYFDEKLFDKLKVIFAESMPSIEYLSSRDQASMVELQNLMEGDEVNKGSEKPTLQKGDKDNLKKETPSKRFQDRMAFVFPSSQVFWGRGAVISGEGQQILSKMAEYIRRMPNNVVVCEYGGGDGEQGLQRAWAVIEFFVSEFGLPRSRFSLAAESMMTPYEKTCAGHPVLGQERGLEVVLLLRRLCN